MSVTLFLMGAQAISDVAKGVQAVKGAKGLANEKRETLELYKKYNEKQLEEAYDKAFSNSMNKYIDDRLNITNQFEEVNSQLNIQASMSGVNLADSSYTNDAQAQLDSEFNKNLQNSYQNLINQTADIVMWKTTNDMKLEQQYYNQISDINNAVTNVENAMWDKAGSSLAKAGRRDKAGSSLANFGMELGKDYSTYGSKKELKGEKGSFKDYLSNDLLNFTF